jgi:transposase-like protein
MASEARFIVPKRRFYSSEFNSNSLANAAKLVPPLPALPSAAWRRIWDNVIPFFAFPPAIGRVIYI